MKLAQKSLTLEFKKAEALQTKNEICELVSSMANSAGGVLIDEFDENLKSKYVAFFPRDYCRMVWIEEVYFELVALMKAVKKGQKRVWFGLTEKRRDGFEGYLLG